MDELNGLAGAHRKLTPGKTHWLAMSLCTLAFLGCVLAANPRSAVAIHDEWSYAYSALILAKTGHVVYNGWGAMMLGWQLYLGAFFIRIFGFSYTVVRASALLIALLTVPVMHRLLVRLGVSPWNATLGTLTFALSPFYLPLAASFTSDVPSFLCMLVCMDMCLRAMDAETDREAIAWLVVASVTNVLGGTVRQVAWLGVLVIVPSTAWYLRRRRGVVAVAIPLWAVSLVAVFGALHWFNHQPYVAIEKLVALYQGPAGLVKSVAKSTFTASLFLLPILSAFALRYPYRNKRARQTLLAVMLTLLIGVIVVSLRFPDIRWLAFLPGEYVSAKRFDYYPWLLGTFQEILPLRAAAAIFWATLSVAAMFAGWLYFSPARHIPVAEFFRSRVFFLTGPFTLAYLVLVLTRSTLFDRYLIPVIFVLLASLLLLYQQSIGGSMSAASALPLAVLALYGVANSHDLFAMSRARSQAIEEIRALGVPRSELSGGLEYDGWTQIELTGYVNEPRIHVPAGAYQPWHPPANVPADCLSGFAAYTPSVHPRYYLSSEPGLCYPDAKLQPVHYTNWIPPHAQSIYIVHVPDIQAPAGTR